MVFKNQKNIFAKKKGIKINNFTPATHKDLTLKTVLLFQGNLKRKNDKQFSTYRLCFNLSLWAVQNLMKLKARC